MKKVETSRTEYLKLKDGNIIRYKFEFGSNGSLHRLFDNGEGDFFLCFSANVATLDKEGKRVYDKPFSYDAYLKGEELAKLLEEKQPILNRERKMFKDATMSFIEAYRKATGFKLDNIQWDCDEFDNRWCYIKLTPDEYMTIKYLVKFD